MGLFKDEAEVYQYLGRIFQVAMENPDLGPKLRKVGSVLKLNQTDPESTIVIDFGEGVVQLGESGTPRVTRPIDAELDMKADTAHLFWLVLQRQGVMFGALSLVVASSGSGLVDSAPV